MRVFVKDSLGPENSAMLQALYSRSNKSVQDHLGKLESSNSSDFMEKYYVGYGHESIGDCGYINIFIEDVSILAAKAIQNSPLYVGQETSTRYIDFSRQEFYNPIVYDYHQEGEWSENHLERWRNFYLKAQKPLDRYLKELYPYKLKGMGINKQQYNKAIQARVFDILRGFLPAGVTTQLSWTTNFSHARKHLKGLIHHPLKEVRRVALELTRQLEEKYPKSFDLKFTTEECRYLKDVSIFESYDVLGKPFVGGTNVSSHSIDFDYVDTEYCGILDNRPRGVRLPNFLDSEGQLCIEFTLDYGSFRDIQRHRKGICRIPALDHSYGFHNWYLGMLPNNLREEANRLLESQRLELVSKAELLHGGDRGRFEYRQLGYFEQQYFIPMGYCVPVTLQYTLPQAVYVAELRSSKSVHPTLRRVALDIGKQLKRLFPNLMLYLDMSPDSFCPKRGSQDIIEM